MRALTIFPLHPTSARLEEVPEPPANDGELLVRTLAIGVCGTDRELVNGDYGAAPQGHERLIIGHESLGIIEEAPEHSGFSRGDRIVGIVRRPDPVPCAACAADEWDMCRNGLYTERGIKARDGFCSERFRIGPKFAVKVDATLGLAGVLLEPMSVVAKAWDQIDYLGRRSKVWNPQRVLITGAGPVGLLAMLLSRQRGLETHVYDLATEGPKPALVRDAGAQYHSGGVQVISDLDADVIIECTGAPSVVITTMMRNAQSAIVCLAGLSAVGRQMPVDIASLNQSMVLQNDLVFGTVNANRHHYELAAEALGKADRSWLNRLITRKVSLDDWQDALQRRPGDIKVVIDFSMQDRQQHVGAH
jgi:threonine dehydrogenase-like Zn-dependent dehydrogenase